MNIINRIKYFLIPCILTSVIAYSYPIKSGISARSFVYTNSKTDTPYTCEDYVQDGLIAMWDGVENAGIGIHDPLANQWVMIYGSLSNQVNISILADGTWGENCLVCSGTNCAAYLYEYDSMYRKELLEIKYSIVHWEVCANPTTWTSGYNDGNKSIIGFRMSEGITGQPFSFRIDVGWRPYVSSGNRRYVIGKVLTGDFVDLRAHTFSCAGTNSDNTNAIWIDGISQQIIENTSGGQYGSGFCIGAANSTGAQSCSGFVFNIRLYNRVLTEAEVAWNHAIDKARFGL